MDALKMFQEMAPGIGSGAEKNKKIEKMDKKNFKNQNLLKSYDGVMGPVLEDRVLLRLVAQQMFFPVQQWLVHGDLYLRVVEEFAHLAVGVGHDGFGEIGAKGEAENRRKILQIY